MEEYDVFISYSSKDKSVADKICETLENNGQKCWIAWRDARPSKAYASEIVTSIRKSKIMVLVFTPNSNISEPVASEVESAFNNKKDIVVFIVEPTEMRDELSFFLKRKHWLNAYFDYSKKLPDLVKVVEDIIGNPKDIKPLNKKKLLNVADINKNRVIKEPLGVKRTLFIGLGGTGIGSILYAKKNFIDTYGEVPPVIGFLGIDIDEHALHGKLLSAKGETVELADSERLLLDVSDIKNRYKECPEDFSWIPEENQSVLNNIKHGAGMVRSNGRVSIAMNYDEVKFVLDRRIMNITNARNSYNKQFYSLGNNVEIHMAFSLAGGTGSGTFMSIASLIKEEYCECILMAYAVLPGIHYAAVSSPSGKANLYLNTYCAVKEMDYVMGMNCLSNCVKLDFLKNRSTTLNYNPFSSVTLIDNKNIENETYDRIGDVLEILGLAFFASIGKITKARDILSEQGKLISAGSFSCASICDKLAVVNSMGSLDVSNKKAWVTGLGICEISYRGSELSRVYQLKVAKRIVDEICGIPCDDSKMVAEDWFDNARIEANQLLDDLLLSNGALHVLVIQDKNNAEAEAKFNINVNKREIAALKEKVQSLSEEFKEKLLELIDTHVKCVGGVSLAVGVIKAILYGINNFKVRAISNLHEEIDYAMVCERKLAMATDSLKDYMKRLPFFRTASREEALCRDVSVAADKYNIIIARRELLNVIILFYSKIEDLLCDELYRIKELRDAFCGLSEQFSKELQGIGNNVSPFRIDIPASESRHIKADLSDIDLKSLPNIIFRFQDSSFNKKFMAEELLKFTQALPKSISFANLTISDFISNADEEELAGIISLAIQKSTPLLKYDYKGYIPQMGCCEFYYICGPENMSSKFFRLLEKSLLVPNIYYICTGASDRIVIYRQMGVVPAYALDCIRKCEKESTDTSVCGFIDAEWKKRMEDEGFDINPTSYVTDD